MGVFEGWKNKFAENKAKIQAELEARKAEGEAVREARKAEREAAREAREAEQLQNARPPDYWKKFGDGGSDRLNVQIDGFESSPQDHFMRPLYWGKAMDTIQFPTPQHCSEQFKDIMRCYGKVGKSRAPQACPEVLHDYKECLYNNLSKLRYDAMQAERVRQRKKPIPVSHDTVPMQTDFF